MTRIPPTQDELLLIDVDFNVPNIWCKAPHPTDPEAMCRRGVGHPDDGFHATRKGEGVLKWAIVRDNDEPVDASHDVGVEWKFTPSNPRDRHRQLSS